MAEEKLVFLKREEIRTMAKDLARLQEELARREKEKIGQLAAAEKTRQETLAREKIATTLIPKTAGAALESSPAELLAPRASLAATKWQKILVRLALVLSFLVSLLALGFLYWYFRVREKPFLSSPRPSTTSGSSTPSSSPSSSATPSITPSKTPTPSSTVLPPALIPVQETQILRLNGAETLPQLLSQSLGDLAKRTDGFFQVALQKNDSFLGFNGFLTELGVNLPPAVKQSVSDQAQDFTFFVYVKNHVGRWGLLVRANSRQATDQALLNWEKSMSPDFQSGLAVLGAAPATDKNWKAAKYRSNLFRYLTLSGENLGLSWATTPDFLLITSSGESLMRALDQLPRL